MKRKGRIERLPSGRFRARDENDQTLGSFDTEAEAELALEGGSLAAFWPGFAVRRRQLGIRDWKNDEGRWELYVAGDPIATVPFQRLARRDAKAWLARMHGRGLAPNTIKNALTLIRLACADAVDSELLLANPFAGMKIKRTAEARTHEGWTILDPDEQLAVLRVVEPEEEYDLVAAALHCGGRNTELFRARPEDVDLEARELVLRYSRRGRGTKGGKPRRVPLFGLGLVAVQSALERAKREGYDVLFPSPNTGERRFDSSHPHHWHDWVERAGIKRHVRFYDLRHTCATSLLAGWWGRKWSIDEVRQMLGHSSVKVTERYAHLVDETLRRAGLATAGLTSPESATAWRTEGASFEIRTRDLRFTNSLGLEGFQLVALRAHYERYGRRDDELAEIVLEGTRLLLTGAPVGQIRKVLARGALILDGQEAAG